MESFLTKFIEFFSSREFKFFSANFNPSDVARASLLTRLSVRAVGGLELGVLGAIFSGQTSSKATDHNLKVNLEELSKYGEVLGIYYKFGQPVMVLAVDAENLRVRLKNQIFRIGEWFTGLLAGARTIY